MEESHSDSEETTHKKGKEKREEIGMNHTSNLAFYFVGANEQNINE